MMGLLNPFYTTDENNAISKLVETIELNDGIAQSI
jgi:hypothetical protein